MGRFGTTCCFGFDADASMQCSDDDVPIYDSIVACDLDPDCEERPLVFSLSGRCLGCLISNDGRQGGPPPIEPCRNGPQPPPPPCVAQKIGESSLVIRTQECMFNRTLLT